MKEAIEKAVKNGLFKGIGKLNLIKIHCSAIECGRDREFWKEICLRFDTNEIIPNTDGLTRTNYRHYSLHGLIFATPFIECLVGEGSCSNNQTPETCTTWKYCNIKCEDCSLHNNADYHRQQMANMKDVEKLKDYVRGLL
jgi:hypothetical protein